MCYLKSIRLINSIFLAGNKLDPATPAFLWLLRIIISIFDINKSLVSPIREMTVVFDVRDMQSFHTSSQIAVNDSLDQIPRRNSPYSQKENITLPPENIGVTCEEGGRGFIRFVFEKIRCQLERYFLVNRNRMGKNPFQSRVFCVKLNN